MLLASAAVALGCWSFLPGTMVDRAAFKSVVRGYANPPLFINGSGTHADPWKLGTITSTSKPDKREAPLIVALGDDPDGVFQTSPPAPIDMAVIFSNFHRLGAKNAATAAVLAWPTPDPIGLAALEKSLARFDSLVMAAPLSRGVVSSPMPMSFRRASIPLASVKGDVSKLPIVNRLSMPGSILGGDNSISGFSYLESEPVTPTPPLLARWEDRVIFSFPVLTVMQRIHCPLEALDILLGEHFKLGEDGPVIPLDPYGRLGMPLKKTAPFAEISAEALIDGGDELFPKTAPDPVILRDDQSNAEPATREFSANLSSMVAAIASNGAFALTNTYPRLPANWEFGLLAALLIALGAISRLTDFGRHVGCAALAAACVSAQWIAIGVASVWLPGIPMLAAIATAVVIPCFIGKSKPVPSPAVEIPSEPETTPAPALAPIPESIPAPEPAPKEKKPRTPREKKSPVETPPAKKAAAKKTPAKKTAAKKAPTKKSPPPDKPSQE